MGDRQKVAAHIGSSIIKQAQSHMQKHMQKQERQRQM
jgi:hypothetical protein